MAEQEQQETEVAEDLEDEGAVEQAPKVDRQTDDPDEPTEHEAGAHGLDDAADGDDADESDEPDDGGHDPVSPVRGLAPRTRQGWRNAAVMGRLIVHFPIRDVRFVCDGHTAMRAMRVFQTRAEGGDAHLDPDSSSALDAWFVLHSSEPLAMSWEPRLPEPRLAAAFDPPVSAA